MCLLYSWLQLIVLDAPVSLSFASLDTQTLPFFSHACLERRIRNTTSRLLWMLILAPSFNHFWKSGISCSHYHFCQRSFMSAQECKNYSGSFCALVKYAWKVFVFQIIFILLSSVFTTQNATQSGDHNLLWWCHAAIFEMAAIFSFWKYEFRMI